MRQHPTFTYNQIVEYVSSLNDQTTALSLQNQ